MAQIPEYNEIKLEKFPYQEDGRQVSETSEFETYDDLKLWKEFKNGNRAAFIFIYHKYFDRMYSYAHQFTDDSELVKDSIQDLFIEINASRTRLTDTDCIHLYLYKAIKRKIIRLLGQYQKVSENNEGFARAGFNVELSVEQKIINRQIAEEQILKLKDSVNKLTGRQREAIFYFYYEGFSLEQVKELMEMQSIKATQNLIYKAIRELRKMLVLLTIALLWAF